MSRQKIDWIKRQKECKKCLGYGYTASEIGHEDGYGPRAWATLCECQPRTIAELEEAVSQGIGNLSKTEEKS